MADIDTFSERLVDMAERFADMTDAAQGRGHRQGGIRARWVVLPAAAAGIYLLGASGSLRRQAGTVAPLGLRFNLTDYDWAPLARCHRVH